MKKRFKTKRRKIKLIYIIIIIIVFYFTFNILCNNTKITDYIINNNFPDKQYLITFKEPYKLLNYTFNNTFKLKEINPVIIENNIKEPTIYIYNSHQLESYKSNYMEAYNITPNVMIASHILKEQLNKHNIISYVETRSISNILKENNWSYSYSYKASRILLEESKNKYPSIKYYIDIHRDSSPQDKTTLEYNNKIYAKVLFIVGKEHPNYEENLKLSELINNKIKEYNEELSRGISIKGGIGVNGIYNQDFSSNVILIEIGGVDNTIEEVNNSIELLANAISEIIGDNNA